MKRFARTRSEKRDQAAGAAGLRAVQRRLHRGRRDAVRVDDPGLDREDDRDRADDRHDPVDGDAEPAGKPAGDPVERMVELVPRLARRGSARRRAARAAGPAAARRLIVELATGGDRPRARRRSRWDARLGRLGLGVGFGLRRCLEWRAPAVVGRRSRGAPHPLAAPRVDPSVVAGEKDLGNGPAAELGRTRVVRILETAVERGREALDLARALASGRPGSRRTTASTSARAGISPPESTYGPMEITSVTGGRGCAGRSPRSGPRAAVSAGSRRELLDELLVELPPRRGERDDAMLRKPPYTASSAAATTSTRSTMPGPPPYGSSSTCPAPSGVESR